MKIVNSYRGTATGSGRTFEQALALDNIAWETSHDLIQWMFPLPEPSRAQPQSPVLTEEELELFRTDEELQKLAGIAVQRWMEFMAGTTRWKRPRDHNHLRITRIIRFLTLIGLYEEAGEVFRVAAEGVEGIVPDITIWYWQEAMNDNPAWLEIR